jgi:hypothetical protein
MAMDTAFVAFWTLAPTLQVHMVGWQISRFASHTPPRLQAAPYLGERLCNRSGAGLPRLLQRDAPRLTLLSCGRVAWPQDTINRLQVLGVETHWLQGIACDSKPTVHAAGQPLQQPLGRPPFRSSALLVKAVQRSPRWERLS